MDEYSEYLKKMFGSLVINLVKHDTSPTGCPAYISVSLNKNPKDKGLVAKELSNYLYRMGFKFQSVPEYLGKGKKTTLRFYMSWEDMGSLVYIIQEKFGFKGAKYEHYLPIEFRSLIIQDVSRSVFPKNII